MSRILAGSTAWNFKHFFRLLQSTKAWTFKQFFYTPPNLNNFLDSSRLLRTYLLNIFLNSSKVQKCELLKDFLCFSKARISDSFKIFHKDRFKGRKCEFFRDVDRHGQFAIHVKFCKRPNTNTNYHTLRPVLILIQNNI